MSQIILIESDDSLRAILKLNMMKTLGCEIIEKKTAQDAILFLDSTPNIDLVVCCEQVGLEKTGFRISTFLEMEESSIPLIVMGRKKFAYKNLVLIDAEKTWSDIIIAAGKELNIRPVFDESKNELDFVPIGIQYFYNLTSKNLGCDVYIKLKKSDDVQYIKRFKALDQVSDADIEKYKDGGLKEFYISKEHFPKFVNFFTAELVGKLNDPAVIAENRLRLNREAFEITIDRLHSLGIDENTVELVEESVKSMEASLKEDNALSMFLRTLRSDKFSYGYAHSYLCSLILHKVVSHFDWESAQVKEKLTFVAFFHDISLKENDYMTFNNEADLANSVLSIEDKKMVLNHALQSAAFVELFPKIPIGVGTILKEHHGSKTGIGFPETLSIGIAPISMMFIVVEHFVDEFLKLDKNPSTSDYEKIFKELGKRYNKITYEQTLRALKDMTLGKKSR